MIAAPTRTPTPGAYLKMRRCAARLSVGDVAARLATVPYLPQHERADWVEMIEADVTPASFATIAALRSVYAFDLGVLVELELLRMGLIARAPRLCRICACSADDACPAGCDWAEADLCDTHALVPA